MRRPAAGERVAAGASNPPLLAPLLTYRTGDSYTLRVFAAGAPWAAVSWQDHLISTSFIRLRHVERPPWYRVTQRSNRQRRFAVALRALGWLAITGATAGIYGADDVEGQSPVKGEVLLVVAPLGMVRQASVRDFDDLHTFNIFFDEVTFADNFGSAAVDAANVIWLGDDTRKSVPAYEAFTLPPAAFALRMRDWQLGGIEGGMPGSDLSMYPNPKSEGVPYSELHPHGRQNGIGLIYGLRVLEKNDQEFRNLRGTILTDLKWRTDAENQLVGPQAGFIWIRSHASWNFHLQGTLLAAYNQSRVLQDGLLDFGAVPGALNQPLFATTSLFSHSESHHDFSPGGELRAEARMQITGALSLRFNWSAIYLNNVSLVQDRTVYQLPDLGLRDPGAQSLFIHDLFCGLELTR